MATHIDTKEYAWKDIDVLFLGRKIAGLEDINYTRETEKEKRYGRGNKPRSIQTGNESVSGSLTVSQSELEGMNKRAKEAGFDSIQDVPVDIIVRYAATGSLTKTIDKIEQAEIKSYEKGMAQNDKYKAHELPYEALALSENI